MDPLHPQVLIHVSGMFKAAQGAFSLMWPLGNQTGRPNEIVLWDLRHDFEPFLELDAEGLRERLFSGREALAARGLQRLPVKTLHSNRCPIVMRDLRLLTPELAERYGLDLAAAQALGARLELQTGFRGRVREACQAAYPAAPPDPDFSIYAGGFFSDGDRAWLDRIGRTPARDLASLGPSFLDARLDELYFRYRARNWPELLTSAEQTRWQAHCRQRLVQPPVPSLLSLDAFQTLVAELRGRHPQRQELWDELQAYAARV